MADSNTGFAGIRDGPVPQDPNMKAMQEYLKEEAGCMSWFDGGPSSLNVVPALLI